MPVIPQQQTIVQYVTNSAQLSYTFAFYAPEATDIQVFYQAPNATPVPSSDQLTLNVDYTVTFNADPITGGTITLLFTPTTSYYLTINRQVQASLTTTFANAQTINGANLDTAFDRLLLLCQQNQNYALDRNLSYVINTYLPNATPYTQLPPLPQNYVWIGSGSGVVAALLSTNPSASVLQSMLANNSPGTDGARLVGYYDANTGNLSTTVRDYLNFLPTYISSSITTAIQSNSQVYGVYTGAVNALAVALTPALTAYARGQIFEVIPANTNTGNTTLAVNGLAAKNVTVLGNQSIQAGDILQNVAAYFFYDGTNFQLLNPQTLFNRKFAGTYLTMSSGQVINLLTTAKLAFDNVVYDTNSWYSVSGTRIIPKLAGYVKVTGMVRVNDSGVASVQGDVQILAYKNGILYLQLGGNPVTGFTNIISGSCTIPVNGTTDYIELYGANNNNARSMTFGSVSAFQVEFIGR